MKTIFDNRTKDELIAKVNSVNENCNAQWGKMNVFQMLKHCAKWNDMMLGKIQVKRIFAGRLFGRLALKSVLKDDAPLRKSTPTAPELVFKDDTGEIPLLKTRLIQTICEYENFYNPDFIHPYFGKMTKEQVGQFVYKHHDHHLRQFGV
jgi:hypothetical protein